MTGVRIILRRLQPHSRVLLLALVVFAGTSYGACAGGDREFGNGGQDSATQTDSPIDTVVVDDTPKDEGTDTAEDSQQSSDSNDDAPSTVD